MSKGKKITQSEVDEAFVQGFAAALATLVRTYDEPTLARDVAACNGYDLRDFALSAVGQFELDALKKAFAAPASKRIRRLQEDNAFLKAQLAGERKNIAGWIAARDANLKRAEFAERQLDEVLSGVCDLRAALEKAQAESIQGATSPLADKRFAAGCVAAFGSVMRIVGGFGTRVSQPQGDARP